MEKSEYLELYRQMVVIRLVEEQSAQLYQQGKIGGFLQRQRAFQSVLRTAGGLMIIAGVSLAAARRGN